MGFFWLKSRWNLGALRAPTCAALPKNLNRGAQIFGRKAGSRVESLSRTRAAGATALGVETSASSYTLDVGRVRRIRSRNANDSSPRSTRYLRSMQSGARS
jgi:hypothetical protein